MLLFFRLHGYAMAQCISKGCGVSRIVCFWSPAFLVVGMMASIAAEPESPIVVEGDILPVIDEQALKMMERPLKRRDPVIFWRGKRVFQNNKKKGGIVIEDKDHIVRENYWILDEFAVGVVEDVRVDFKGVQCLVRFPNEERWDVKSRNKREEIVQEVASVGKEGVVFKSYRPEGDAVDPEQVGVIESRGENGTTVWFSAKIISVVAPRLNQKVIRSADWCDGYADGGPCPIGAIEEGAEQYVGTVVSERDLEGNIDIEWMATGRTTTHRFDVGDWFDVQVLDPKMEREAIAPPGANGNRIPAVERANQEGGSK